MLTLCEQVTDTLNSLAWPRLNSQTAQLTSTSSLCKWRVQIIACFILLFWCLGADGRKWTRLEATKWNLCKPLLAVSSCHCSHCRADIQPVLPLSDARAAWLLLSPASRNSSLASINCQLCLQPGFKEATQSPIIHGERWVSPPKSRCTELLFLKNALNPNLFVWQGRRLGWNKLCL